MIIAAMAALAALIPPTQDTLDHTAPLTFLSKGAPYDVAVAYATPAGPVVHKCSTPCTVHIPQLAPFALEMTKAGYTVRQPKLVQWAGYHGEMIAPDVIRSTPVPKGAAE